MPDYSNNSYFAVAKQGIIQEPSTQAEVKPISQVKIDPNVKYDKFIRFDGDKIYFVENGNAHWIKNPETYRALGGDFGKEVTVGREVMRTLNLRVAPIDMNNVEEFKVKEEEKVPEIKKEDIQPVIEVNKEETLEVEKQNLRTPGMMSYIIVVSTFEPEAILKLAEEINKFKELVKGVPNEVILIANGTTMVHNSPQFAFADKVVVLPVAEEFSQAIDRGIRISKGEYPLLIC